MPQVRNSEWTQQTEALLARTARRTKNPLEFIRQVLEFVCKELKSKYAVFYMKDQDAPSLSSILNKHAAVRTKMELIASVFWGEPGTRRVLRHSFIPQEDGVRLEDTLKRVLANEGDASVETIAFGSDDSEIFGVIAVFGPECQEQMSDLRSSLKPVLEETAIMLDFIVDRALYKDIINLHRYGLSNPNFGTTDSMCQMVERTRSLIGCEGISFFLRDATTDDDTFWLAASSPKTVPPELVSYTPQDNNLTARAISYAKPAVIHDLAEVRRRITTLKEAKWCELQSGRVDRNILFVPVLRNGTTMALLRCTNKGTSPNDPSFNWLDIRRAVAFAELLFTWHSAIENEVRFTSSLLDIAHELHTSAAGIKARAEYAGIIIKARMPAEELLLKKLNDICINIDSILEMMTLLTTAQSGSKAQNEPSITPPFKAYADLCVPVVNGWRERAASRQLRFQFFGEHQLGLIYYDVKVFNHIMQNLIGNAVKYSNKGNEIKIYFFPPSTHSRYAAIRVTSQGLPILPEEREQIFRFRYRAQSAVLSGVEGEGRGLPIARAKARQFKGDLIYVEAEHLNVFSLMIPRELFRPQHLLT